MSTNLVIVESPAKAKTINKYLGKDFQVLASYGHVRDLVPKEGAVDPDHDFAMKYDVIDRNSKHVDAIAKALKKADALYLVTHPDREGEAISWHLAEILQDRGLLKDKPVRRVVFHEITKRAIQDAIDHPRDVSMDLVNAQQARRALDYLVGFNLSPLLWKKSAAGLSAGRVQSPALRMIVERELEIEAFKPREYWSVEADLKKDRQPFVAKLHTFGGERVQQFTIDNGDRAHEVEQALLDAAGGQVSVAKVEKKQRRRNPTAPFITSTLQQEASRKLGFSTQRTMRVAQQLYEGVDTGGGAVGLITYMRTDSAILPPKPSTTFATHREAHGADKLPKTPHRYKTRAKNAQEAHEAIRPTSAAQVPDEIKAHLTADQYKLYDLVWKRAVACQMIHATINTVSVDLACGEGNFFRATGSTVEDPGFMAVYQEGVDDSKPDTGEKFLPPLKEGEQVPTGENPTRATLHRATASVQRSQPGASARGARNRPSVHLCLHHLHAAAARIRGAGQPPLQTHRRGPGGHPLPTPAFQPVRGLRLHRPPGRRLGRRLPGREGGPTDAQVLGPVQTTGGHQGRIRQPFRRHHRGTGRGMPQVRQTAQDPARVAAGASSAAAVYPECDYTRNLGDDAAQEPETPEVVEGRTCPKCESPLIIRTGRYGKFIGCSAYPKCKHIEPLEKPQDTGGHKRPECNKGSLLKRKSRYGKRSFTPAHAIRTANTPSGTSRWTRPAPSASGPS